MSAAREEIMAAVRARLTPVGSAVVPLAPMPAVARSAGLATAAERLDVFRSTLESVSGLVTVVPDAASAAVELQRIAAELAVKTVAVSDGELVREVVARLPGEIEVFRAWSDRTRLADCDLGVTSAQWGIAETGTLVLDSSRERGRLASLVPPVHVAILPSGAILATLGDALAAVRGEGTEPACITFVTGPSRTADIELTLVVGVHGPEQLHVLVIDGETPIGVTEAK